MSYFNSNALLRAESNNDISGISSSIRHGAHVNIVDGLGWTCLHRAVNRGWIEGVKVLLANGASVDRFTPSGCTALAIAASKGHVALVEHLLDRGANINTFKKTGFSPLASAVYEGHLEIAKILIDKGADVDLCDDSGNTPLIHSINQRKSDVFRYLLTVGADINKANKMNETPLSLALYKGNSEYADILKQTRPTEILNHFIRTRDHINVIYLLRRKVNINKIDEKGNTPLDHAVKSRNLQITQLLLDNGAHFSIPSALSNAIADGDLKITKLLLGKCVNVNLIYNNGSTPLLQALEEKKLKIAKLLIEAGANVNLDGTSLLVQTLEENHLEGGAGVNVIKKCGHTLLTKCAQMDDLEMVEFLLTKQVDINQIDRNGNTALTLAAKNLNFVMFDKLVNAGGDIERTKEKLDEVASHNDNFAIYLEFLRNKKRKTTDNIQHEKNKADDNRKQDCGFKSVPYSTRYSNQEEDRN